MEFDTAEYRCKFILKNLTKKPTKIRVGFPLDREVHGAGPASNATDMVMSYHFIARDADNTYHVQYIGGGDKSKYNDLFLWDMTSRGPERQNCSMSDTSSKCPTPERLR